MKHAVLKLFVLPFLVTTDNMIADIFAKAADKDMFLRARDNILNVQADKSMLDSRMKARRLHQTLTGLLDRLL